MESWEIKSDHVFDRRHLNIFKKWWIDIDKINFLLIVAIIIFGFIMTTISSPYVADKISAGKLFFIKKQIIFSVLAIITLSAISFLNSEQIKILSIAGIFLSIALLMAVLLFGSEAKGAKRWLIISGFTLQPSEFAKTFFLVFNAFLLQRFYNERWILKYGISIFLYSLIALLFISQPDFGMTLTFTALWGIQLFIFGLPLRFVSFMGILAVMGGIYSYIALPHVTDRIDKFLNIKNKNYQVERSIDAYINGGLFGTGPGDGLVKKYIPDAHTDFIFAVVGEEFGLISSLAILAIFFVIVSRVFKRIVIETNPFSFLALTGLICQFTLQILVNIGVSLGILPTKGMTLPFISYGGSSIIAMSICFGIILALTKKKYGAKNDYIDVDI